MKKYILLQTELPQVNMNTTLEHARVNRCKSEQMQAGHRVKLLTILPKVRAALFSGVKLLASTYIYIVGNLIPCFRGVLREGFCHSNVWTCS